MIHFLFDSFLFKAPFFFLIGCCLLSFRISHELGRRDTEGNKASYHINTADRTETKWIESRSDRHLFPAVFRTRSRLNPSCSEPVWFCFGLCGSSASPWSLQYLQKSFRHLGEAWWWLHFQEEEERKCAWNMFLNQEHYVYCSVHSLSPGRYGFLFLFLQLSPALDSSSPTVSLSGLESDFPSPSISSASAATHTHTHRLRQPRIHC